MKARVLLVEDEEAQRRLLAQEIEDWGYEVFAAADVARARRVLGQERIDVLVTDLRLPDGDGLDLLRELRERNPVFLGILITAFATVDSAVEAIREGAFDYLTKPIDLTKLEVVLARAVEKRNLVEENRVLRERVATTELKDGLVTRSPKMEEVLALAQRVAEGDSSVLLTGESGTGKEVLARLIHRVGARREASFLAVNCAALAPGVLESELFGHEKGAFTGATARRAGVFERADRGTLLLDEIGEMPPDMQVKLLRVLQEGEFERVGGTETLRADVRILAATHRDLRALVEEGRFREDLYYRLNVVEIAIPPLRERREDIPALAEHFLRKYGGKAGGRVRGFTPEVMDALVAYDYPGNIRELENIVERGLVVSRHEWLTLGDLPSQVLGRAPSASGRERGELPLGEFLDAIERQEIEAALARSDGRQASAARELGLSERMLRYKMKKYGLQGRRR
jgi:two-component system response regulator AtoC